MKLTSNIPYSKWDYKICAVYQITFNTNQFYIGCSENLRNRAIQWKSLFNGGKPHQVGKEAVDAVVNCKYATLDIIELCEKKNLKDLEAFYLNKNRGNPLMVSKPDCAWRPVLQYKTDGSFIKKHLSVRAAACSCHTRVSKIQEVADGKRFSHKEMRFFYVDSYQKHKRGYVKILAPRKNGRNVIKMDADKNTVGVYKTIRAAAKETGCSQTTVRDSISGRRKTGKGYFWSYE